MSDFLLYQTSDPNFADEIVEALRASGIEAYRVGEGVERIHAVHRRSYADLVSIFVKSESDLARANDIAVKLGAIVEPPRRKLQPWQMVLITALIVFISLFVALNA